MANTPEEPGSPAKSADEQDVQDGATVSQLVSPEEQDTEVPAIADDLPDTLDVAADPSDVILDPAITGGHEAQGAVHDTSDPQSPAFVDSGEALATLASLSAQDSAQGLKRRMSGSPGEEGPIKHARRDRPAPLSRDALSDERDNDNIEQRDQQPDNMLRSPVMAMPVHYQHMSPAMVAHAHLPDHNPYASSASQMFQSGVNQLSQAQSPTGSQSAGAPYFPNYSNSAVPYDSPYSGNQQQNWNMQGYTSNMPPSNAGLGMESGRPHMDRSVSHEESMRMGGSMDMGGVPGGPGLLNTGIGGSGYGGESSIRGNGIADSAFDMYNPQDQVVHDLNASDSLLNLHSGGMYPGSLANAHHNQDLRSATLQSPSMQLGAQMEHHQDSGGDEYNPVLGGANAKARDEKQRKRIIQACEPCRIRKAKCNGLQPCGRCGQRGLPCIYANERRMRGPNKVKKSQTEKEQANRERQQRKAAERHAQDIAAVHQQGMPVQHHMHPHHQHSTMIDDDIVINAAQGPIEMRQPFSPSDPRAGKDEPENELSRSLLSAYDASNGNPNSASLHQHGQLLSNWPGSGFNVGPQHYMEGMSTSSSRDYDRSDRTTDQRMFYGNHPANPGTGGQADFGGQYQLGGYASGPAVSASPPSPPQSVSYPREYYPQAKTIRSPLISGERELDYGGMEETAGPGAAATHPYATSSMSTRYADPNMANMPTHHARTGSNTDLAVSSVRGAAAVDRDISHLRSSAAVEVAEVAAMAGLGGAVVMPVEMEQGHSGNGTPVDGNLGGGRSSIAGMLLGDLTPHEDQELDHEPSSFPEE